MPYPFTAEDLQRLKQWDTPTICNGLELIVPERRAIGFTTHSMHAPVRLVATGRAPGRDRA